MLIVAITGGLATGKTTVAKMFMKRGALCLDADRIAHRLLWKNSPCYNRVIQYFGKNILGKGGIDRKKLAQRVFSSRKELKKLEHIIHPFVAQRIQQGIVKFKRRKGVLILDVPLLFEAKMQRLADKVIVVTSTSQQQRKRAKQQRHLKNAAIEQRIKAQMPLNEKIRRADFIIDNSQTKQKTRKQVKQLWQKFQQIVKK